MDLKASAPFGRLASFGGPIQSTLRVTRHNLAVSCAKNGGSLAMMRGSHVRIVGAQHDQEHVGLGAAELSPLIPMITARPRDDGASRRHGSFDFPPRRGEPRHV